MTGIDEQLAAVLSRRIEGCRALLACERLSAGASQETYRILIRTAAGEKKLAMRRAQELMLKHQLAVDPARRRYVSRQLGEPMCRKNAAAGAVGGLLAEYFFVQLLWIEVYVPMLGKKAKVLEASGTPENVAMAEYVYSFLLATTERLWKEARVKQPKEKSAR